MKFAKSHKNDIENGLLRRNLQLLAIEKSDQLDQINTILNTDIDMNLRDFILLNANRSHSQLFQDLVVLYHLGKKSGYFVDFGASDGFFLSNTFLLEKEYNWTGILVEPGRTWHNELFKNRKVQISKKCVWAESNQNKIFNETSDPLLSTIDEFSSSDHWSKNRIFGEKYSVETISLIELLEVNNSPSTIDYLSIDTEGSEFDILEKFDFSKYQFKFISVEHNYSEHRDKIYSLLTSNSYVRILSEISKWDDWYISI